MLFSIVSCLILIACIKASNVVNTFDEMDLYLPMFESYLQSYGKSYQGELYNKRFEAFRTNLRRIVQHNEQYHAGNATFTLGLNEIADLSDKEYKMLLGYRKSDTTRKDCGFTVKASDENLPDSWDWREHDAVTPVKNQGMCGSCWAFSAVASMECVYAQRTGKLESFSEQELVDCVLGGSDTCTHGGEMQDGFDEIIRHHGGKIDTEKVYAYTAASKGKCHADDSKAIGHFTSYANVTSGDEDAMKAAVAEHSVLSIAIDASSFYFQLYRHGVFSWPFCKNDALHLDHGVAVVGYGTKSGKDFWLVKNSWGTSWGMKGYIMMSRNKNNQCGVATDASFPNMK